MAELRIVGALVAGALLNLCYQAGNLLHLKTEFAADMTATNFPQLGSVMLKLLHPTSAVCGMPHDKALQFLRDNEA